MSTHIDFHALAEQCLSTFPTSNLYFLLDQSGMPGMCHKLSRSSSAWVSLFNGTVEASTLEVAPILILGGSNGRAHVTQSLLDWIGKKGTYTSTVTVLLSPLPIDLMVERLKNRLSVRLSEDMDAMLRFFDPRVLESLEKILSVEQSAAFFGIAEVWKYVNRAGQLKQIRCEFHAVDKFVTPFTMTQEQEFDLIDASEIDQVLDLIKTNMPALVTSRPLCQQYEFIKQKVEGAREHGLDSILKYAFYIAAQGLEGDDFVETPEWTHFLGKVKDDNF